MENQSRTNEEKDSKTRKTFGKTALQLNENDDALGLIGGIVEKGFSDEQPPQRKPISAPKPSVLPFPVARHRSHGPHWAPIGSRGGSNVDNDDGEEDEDDEDRELMKYDSIAAFAGPVRRKEKKSLNFNRWKEIMNEDDLSSSQTERHAQSRKGRKYAVEKNASSKMSIDNADMSASTKLNVKLHGDSCEMAIDTIDGMKQGSLSNGPTSSIVDMELDSLHGNQHLRNGSDVASGDLKDEPVDTSEVKYALPDALKELERGPATFSGVCSSSVNDFGHRNGSMSVKSQIDAENRTRLQSMSPEEIAEAQTEIMEKINPELLKVLKNRGVEKLKKQKVSVLSTDQNENKLTQEAESSSTSDSKIPDGLRTTSSKVAQSILDNSVDQKSGSTGGSLWDAWSQRVEGIREQRFSLEGNVVRNDKEIGKSAAQNTYNANNVAERDFLRTEGDPAAVGYTIKEALALTRSVIPGQRALALHLLACVLEKALQNICKPQVGFSVKNANDIDGFVDWEAVWTYALGPEPELVLSLRMLLDDNHSSVVFACAKLIQCVLSCDENENYFNLSEKLASSTKGICTAPIFRSKPEINDGFLRGGFWKYSAKPSNIFPFVENIMEDTAEGEHTIQDDVVVGGQDVAAGLVRMGILPRILYLLETDPSAALEECLLSVLIAIARHSPTCANAIINCERLVQTVVNRFTVKDYMEIHPAKIKSVRLLKVLACSDKKHCMEFIKKGILRNMTWQLYQYRSSLDQWIKSGKENCALSAALTVEQLRFWRVCIQYGYCVAQFLDLFPALCMWLTLPTFEKLAENNVLTEFASVSAEAYLFLAALAVRLPTFHSQKHLSNQIPVASDETETWHWSHVGPMVDAALKWLVLGSSHVLGEFYDCHEEVLKNSASQHSSVGPLLWVMSAVMNMLSTVLERIIPENTTGVDRSGCVPCIPEFVPRIGFEIIKNSYLSSANASGAESSKVSTGRGTLIERLCQWRHHGGDETSLASVCCLQGLVRVIVSIDKLIQLAKAGIKCPPQGHDSSREGKILEDGILKWSLVDMRSLLNIFLKLVASEWQLVQSIEKFSRGGPAPGLGVGWGASGGGYWSTGILLAQTDAAFLVFLHEIFQVPSIQSPPGIDDIADEARRVNSLLEVCLLLGPRDRNTMEKALRVLLQVRVLKFLSVCIKKFPCLSGKTNLLSWSYEEDDFLLFSNILLSHFKKRWLSIKRSKPKDKISSGNKTFTKTGETLETIYEENDMSCMISEDHGCASLTEEWARQRLPLPVHWLLSPIATICDVKQDSKSNASNILDQMHEPTEILEISQAGLFMLLGVEAMSFLLPADVPSPVRDAPLLWKLHSLSVTLLVGMGVLEEEKSRDVYQTLQEIYGQVLDGAWHKSKTQILSERGAPESEERRELPFLRFQNDLHDSYPTFIETLVEQFSAISYGDVVYGRQVAIYLHRAVEAPVRLATWNALSNARVLELLPPLGRCFASAEGYLEPVEDDERILEAYAKSWVSGALDRAAARESVTFTLFMHHLSSFIFHKCSGDKLLLRNKLARTLLRDYSQKPQRKRTMIDFIQYQRPDATQMPEDKEPSALEKSKIEEKLEVLVEACERNSSLLAVVEEMRSSIML